MNDPEPICPAPDMAGSSACCCERAIRFFRIDQVLTLTGFRSKSALYARIKQGKFPRGNRVSHKMVIWAEPVIARWQKSCLQDLID